MEERGTRVGMWLFVPAGNPTIERLIGRKKYKRAFCRLYTEYSASAFKQYFQISFDDVNDNRQWKSVSVYCDEEEKSLKEEFPGLPEHRKHKLF